MSDSGSTPAFTYVASCESIDNDLTPYTWYLRYVVIGAKEHNLPQEYIRKLESVRASLDPDEDRNRCHVQFQDRILGQP